MSSDFYTYDHNMSRSRGETCQKSPIAKTLEGHNTDAKEWLLQGFKVNTERPEE